MYSSYLPEQGFSPVTKEHDLPFKGITDLMVSKWPKEGGLTDSKQDTTLSTTLGYVYL